MNSTTSHSHRRTAIETEGQGTVSDPNETTMSPQSPLAAEPTKAQTAAALGELKRSLRMPPPPVPEESLMLLYDAACQDTGGSQAARNFLFWLAGQCDPTEFVGCGGLELRRLDRHLKAACFEVLNWWAGPTKSDAPLYEILHKLRDRFTPETKTT